MREILFRGKRAYNGDWVYGNLLHLPNGTVAILSDKRYVKIIPETVGQYTGVIDKNGKKVFEGDIIDYTWDTLCGGKEHRTYVISYANNEAKFVGDCVIGNPRHSLPTFEYIGERGEVIGNIYDNKEILEGKE